MTSTTARRPLLPVVRWGAVSVLWRPRAVVVVAVLLVATLLGCALHVSLGGSAIDFGAVLSTLLGAPPDPRTELAVMEFRMPRTVAVQVLPCAP